MAEILEFPSRRSQGLAYLERELRQLLSSKGADQTLVDFACQQLTTLYSELTDAEHYQCHVRLPEGLDDSARDQLYDEINTALSGLQREQHTLLVGLVARLVLTELRLFQHERPEP